MNTGEKPKESILQPASKFWRDLIDLKTGVDKLAVIQEIKSKKSMNGANAWMLMCSIMIASIGLNMNSPAVIIGAMLISPLMSPILGIGLAVGINDKELLRKALRHFGAATLIAVLTSTLYFYFSPFQEFTPEIEARTAPTFLDIIIAFFGGIAGIVSIARKDISTTLPGVAIATALMPPLCVTGYGIANGQFGIASSSFYLFFLNTLFVSLATYFIIRYLEFPYKKFVDSVEKRRNLLYITGFVVVTMIPSVFIFNRIYSEFRTKTKIQEFIQEYIGEDEIYLDEYELIPSDSINRLVMKVYGNYISRENIEFYQQGLIDKKLYNTKIEIIPTSEIKLDRLKFLESKISGVEKIASQLEIAKKENEEKDQLVNFLKEEVDNRQMDSTSFRALCQEIRILYPNISAVSLAFSQSFDFQEYQDHQPILILDWDKKVSKSSIKANSDKIREWLLLREDYQSIKLINQ